MNNNPYTPTSTAQVYPQHGARVPLQLTSPQRQPPSAGMPNWQGRDISHIAQLAQLLQASYFLDQQGQMFTCHFNPGFAGLNSARIAAVQPHVRQNNAQPHMRQNNVQPHMRQNKKPAPAHISTPHTPEHRPDSPATSNPPPTRTSEHNPGYAKKGPGSFSQTSNPPSSQQDTEQTTHTSSANRNKESSEGAEASTTKDSKVLAEAFASSPVDHLSRLQTAAQIQRLMAGLYATRHSYDNNIGMLPYNSLPAATSHLFLQQNQNYKIPLLPTPGVSNQLPSNWIPYYIKQCTEVIQCLNHYQGQRIYGNITYVKVNKSAGLGNAYLYPLHIKFRIRFPGAFKELSSKLIYNMRVEGNLTFNQSKIAAYVQKHALGAFYDPNLQNVKPAKDIPINLQATALIDSANRRITPERITPECQKVLNHIRSLFGQPITADILVFFNQHQGGIAVHYDEATGISTRFLFRLPDEELKNVPIEELSKKYPKLQAQINPINDEILKSYVFGLGSETFMRDITIHRIKLRSSKVSFLPKED